MGRETMEQGLATESLLVNQTDNVSFNNEYGDDGGLPLNDSHVTTILACSTFVAACGCFTYGYVVTYSAPTESAITEDLSLSVAEYSMFGSILTIGGLVGALVCGKITDLIGRKSMIWILDLIYISGWLAIALAKGPWMLDIGRLLLGFASAIGAYVVPIYLAEVTPKRLRGELLSIAMLMTACGMSFVYLIGFIINWRLLALIGITPCLLQLIGLWFIPESPRWLAKIGKEKEFEAALVHLRGENANIVAETAEIKDYIEKIQFISKGGILDMFQRKYAFSITVGVGLMVLQQFGGLNGYTFYTDTIFVSAGISSIVGFIAVSVIQIVLNILGVILIDKCGRRPLLIVSVAGTFVGSFLTGLAYLFQGIEWWKKEVTPILAFISVMIFMGAYGLGMGGIPWIIISEILPINIKGSAGSACNVFSYICAWIVSYTFYILLDWSSAGIFFIFGVVNGLGMVFVTKLVPETKGRTLEEIQASVTHFGQ